MLKNKNKSENSDELKQIICVASSKEKLLTVSQDIVLKTNSTPMENIIESDMPGEIKK